MLRCIHPQLYCQARPSTSCFSISRNQVVPRSQPEASLDVLLEQIHEIPGWKRLQGLSPAPFLVFRIDVSHPDDTSLSLANTGPDKSLGRFGSHQQLGCSNCLLCSKKFLQIVFPQLRPPFQEPVEYPARLLLDQQLPKLSQVQFVFWFLEGQNDYSSDPSIQVRVEVDRPASPWLSPPCS